MSDETKRFLGNVYDWARWPKLASIFRDRPRENVYWLELADFVAAAAPSALGQGQEGKVPKSVAAPSTSPGQPTPDAVTDFHEFDMRRKDVVSGIDRQAKTPEPTQGHAPDWVTCQGDIVCSVCGAEAGDPHPAEAAKEPTPDPNCIDCNGSGERSDCDHCYATKPCRCLAEAVRGTTKPRGNTGEGR